MRRRTFLAGLGFAALQLAGCGAKPQTTPDYVLTYADNQPAGYPTTQGAQYFCGSCAAADRGQGGHSGQSERRVRLGTAGVGAACHWRRRFCACVAFGGHRRSAPAQRAAAAVSLPECRPYVACAGWQHRSRIFAGLYRAGAGGAELVRRGCPLVLCPSAGAQPE